MASGFAVGDPSETHNPHEVTIRNETSRTRQLEFRIRDVDTGLVVVERSFTLEPDQEIAGKLRDPGAYEVRINLSETEEWYVRSVTYFDTCNDYSTTVTIGADGEITAETQRTLLQCQTPTTGT